MTVLMERPHDVDGEQGLTPEALLDSMELPPGYKAELIEGDIVMSPPPDEEHEETFAEINHQFNARGWRVSGNYGLATPRGRFLPDLTVAPREFFARRTGENWRSPERAALVVEITSTNPGKDRDAKRRGYAAAGIPLYLLVDRGRQETVLFTDPQHGDYRRALPHPSGQAIPLPAPFSFPLEAPR